MLVYQISKFSPFRFAAKTTTLAVYISSVVTTLIFAYIEKTWGRPKLRHGVRPLFPKFWVVEEEEKEMERLKLR